MRFAACLLLIPSLFAQPAPDKIYYNAKVLTMADKQPAAEAFAIRGEHFVAVGSSAAMLALAGPATQKIDLHGRNVLPGLIDSHTHPISSALSEREGAIPVMHSIPEIQAFIRAKAAKLPPDRIIFVPKVYSTRLQERRYPTRAEIDAAAPGRLTMADNGYASILSTALLAQVHITRDTPQPANGKILKDAHGEPTGLVLGAPQLLGKLRASAPATHADKVWALKAMQKRYNEVGITSTIDRGEGPDGFRVYQELHRKGELTVRSYVTYLLSGQGTPQQLREEIQRIPFVTGWGDDWFRVGSLKTVIDGGILIGTAYLREPYGSHTAIYGYEEPEYRGVLTVSRENVFEMARTANELGWQMTAHTTGGGATDLLLDAYEATDKVHSIRDRRFTVTHGNFPNARAIERSKKLGVVYDIQPAWMHLDAHALKTVFGPERMADFQPMKTLFREGIVVAGGSDHMIRFDPREAINPFHPFYGMWMAITRRLMDGTVLHPEQRLTRMEALRMWTLNSAYLSFEERSKGSIEAGKLADFVVVTKDYANCPEDEIKDIETLTTVVGGKTVYQR